MRLSPDLGWEQTKLAGCRNHNGTKISGGRCAGRSPKATDKDECHELKQSHAGLLCQEGYRETASLPIGEAKLDRKKTRVG
jgi:hypothetical protein